MLINKIPHGDCFVFEYLGIKVMQVYGVHEAFDKLAEYCRSDPFRLIIELGADYGGLTNMLADRSISEHAIIHTFDINKDKFTNLYPDKITFNHVDIYRNLDNIASMIASNPRTLVLCDGGNKAREFNSLSPHLKKGDIIMAHDYAPDRATHNENIENGRWNWWEFDDSQIEDKTLQKTVDFFDDYVWCFRERV